MNNPHQSRVMPLRAIAPPVRRALPESGAGPDSAPPHRVALRRAGHPWPAIQESP
jgi:hypothetical protein